jgi:NAD(P)-dependent dehydrogenase (short-subunit alcohol dehydrogenase family)
MQSKISGISKDNLLASELEMIPLGRLAKPGEIARLVIFLSSEENAYITTGESINISGGFEVH